MIREVNAGDSISAAVAAADDGDVVRLQPSRYVGRVKISKRVKVEAGDADVDSVDIRADGVEWIGGTVRGAAAGYSFRVVGCRDVKIVGVECLGGGHYGVRVEQAEAVSLDKLNVSGSRCGVMVSASSEIEIMNSEIGNNETDGVMIANGSKRVNVFGCFIHHHLGASTPGAHCDGLQLFGDCEDVNVIGCRFLANQQHVMVEGSKRLKFELNSFVGSSANSLTFGHGTVRDVQILGNVIAFSGLSLLNLTGSGFSIADNVFLSGNERPAYLANNAAEVVSDNNQFFQCWRECSKPFLFVDGKGFHESLEAAAAAGSVLELASVVKEPKFANVPLAIATVDPKRMAETVGGFFLPLWSSAELFEVGDVVEVNFDGIARRVVAIENGGLVIDPGLEKVPAVYPMVATWGPTLRSLRVDLTVDLPKEIEPAPSVPFPETELVSHRQVGDRIFIELRMIRDAADS